MLTKTDLEKLATLRLEDAKLLFDAGKPSSAYYLSGYAIELAFKVCISKQIQASVIPDKKFIIDIYSHNLEKLLGHAGLRAQFENDMKADPQLETYWGIVTKWDEQSRYEFWDPLSAADLLEAISDPANGVFQWVKKHW
jgi:HEPN domain-containing protein